MLRLAVICALIVFTGARTPKVLPIKPILDGRIIGGEPTTIKDLPYGVFVLARGSHICGGSILSRNKILTAAHCAYGSGPGSLSVRAGSTNRDSGGTVAYVSRFCIHPGYNAKTYDNDVSVLILYTYLTFSTSIQPVTLAQLGSSVPDGVLATISGWGPTVEGGSSSPVLRKVSVPKVSQEYCRSVYGQSVITDSMTCYGYPEGGKGPCQGDLGGPLVINRTQVGVASWGDGCANDGKLGVYADTSKAIIQNHINYC